MGFIELKKIEVAGGAVEYFWSFDDSLQSYFSGKRFVIEYPESMEEVPFAVLAIPFAVNLLPIAWLTDSFLSLPVLDRDFYESIPLFQKGYRDMYPEASFRGGVEASELIDCRREGTDGAIMLFSGGVDATATLLRHYQERPELLTYWGSDIAYDNAEGFRVMENGLREAAALHRLPLFVVRTSFRDFDCEEALDREFFPVLKDGWWHGVKHSIALIGQAAPLLWLHKRNRLYIAASFTRTDQGVRCASYPTIDERVSFFGCRVIHDAFELSRQNKIQEIIKGKKEKNLSVSLKVCWESKSGKNCCRCEKCYRTMMGFFAEGEDPADYGFVYEEESIFEDMYHLIALKTPAFSKSWNGVKAAVKANRKLLSEKGYAEKIAWVAEFDFEHPESNRCRIAYRKKLKRRSLKARIGKRLPWLRALYHKVVRRNKLEK